MRYNSHVSPHSLYIHWPFCRSTCMRCPYPLKDGHKTLMMRYHQALVTEIRRFGEQCQGSRAVETLFIGGQTATTYPVNLLLDTSGTLKRIFSFQKDQECTIEIDVEAITERRVAYWRSLGINRLSVAVHAVKDHVTRTECDGRTIAKAERLLRVGAEQISNISVDLIVDPCRNDGEWKRLIYHAVHWPITHVSVYMMSDEDRVQHHCLQLISEESMVARYKWTADYLERHQFAPYEFLNFAKLGYESKHQIMYGDRKPYKAFGAGGCSFDGTHRFQNEIDSMRYIERIEQGTDATLFWETMHHEQHHLETLLLGLRRQSGVPWHEALHNLSPVQQQRFRERVAWLKTLKLLQERDGRLSLTRAGWFLENRIVLELMQQ